MLTNWHPYVVDSIYVKNLIVDAVCLVQITDNSILVSVGVGKISVCLTTTSATDLWIGIKVGPKTAISIAT
jgi:hypothetical protein